jgi:hypothetical protein
MLIFFNQILSLAAENDSDDKKATANEDAREEDVMDFIGQIEEAIKDSPHKISVDFDEPPLKKICLESREDETKLKNAENDLLDSIINETELSGLLEKDSDNKVQMMDRQIVTAESVKENISNNDQQEVAVSENKTEDTLNCSTTANEQEKQDIKDNTKESTDSVADGETAPNKFIEENGTKEESIENIQKEIESSATEEETKDSEDNLKTVITIEEKVESETDANLENDKLRNDDLLEPCESPNLVKLSGDDDNTNDPTSNERVQLETNVKEECEESADSMQTDDVGSEKCIEKNEESNMTADQFDETASPAVTKGETELDDFDDNATHNEIEEGIKKEIKVENIEENSTEVSLEIEQTKLQNLELKELETNATHIAIKKETFSENDEEVVKSENEKIADISIAHECKSDEVFQPEDRMTSNENETATKETSIENVDDSSNQNALVIDENEHPKKDDVIAAEKEELEEEIQNTEHQVEDEKMEVEEKSNVPENEESVESDIDDEKPNEKTFKLNFLRKFSSSYGTLSRQELEELLLQKTTEAIIYKTKSSELHARCEKQEEIINGLKNRITVVAKQYNDFVMIQNNLMKQLKERPDQPITPVKITRAVGLQVSQSSSNNLKGKMSNFPSTTTTLSFSPMLSKTTVKRPNETDISKMNGQSGENEMAKKKKSGKLITPMRPPLSDREKASLMVQEASIEYNIRTKIVRSETTATATTTNGNGNLSMNSSSASIDLTDEDDFAPAVAINPPALVAIQRNNANLRANPFVVGRTNNFQGGRTITLADYNRHIAPQSLVRGKKIKSNQFQTKLKGDL